MLPAAASSGALSADAFMSALHGLTEEEWIRVGEAARRYASYCATIADDLLSEAITRTLDGKRHCPCDEHPVAFLIQTMRSIAHELRQAGKRTVGMDDVKPTTKDGTKIAFDPKDDCPDPEQMLADKQAEDAIRSAILALFPDDPVARDLAEGIMAELEGEELRAYVGLEPVAFASKRRFVRRRIDKAYPDGCMP
jgi:DNA-directed RNA polymerase specialized sigma24 family protein